MSARFPDNLNALVELAKGTRWEHVAGDEAKLEQLLVQEMAASSDPVTREIGSGLADGTMTWHTVATSSAYTDYVNSSLDAMRAFDFEGVAESLAADKAETERADAARRELDGHDDADAIWQGIDKDRR